MRERGLLKFGDHFTKKYFINPGVDKSKSASDLAQFPLPPSAETFDAFQASSDGLYFRVGCFLLLLEVLEFINERRPFYMVYIENFMTEHIRRDGNDIHYNKSNIVLYQQGIPCLANIVALLKNNDIPHDARLDIAKNLLTDIAVCGPGVYTNIANAFLALQSYLSLSAEFRQFRSNIAKTVLMDAIRSLREKISISVAMEIHYANAVVNQFADELAIEHIDDAFIGFCDPKIIEVLMLKFKRDISDHIKPSKQIDSIVDGLRYEDFVEQVKQSMTDGSTITYNDILSRFMTSLKLYGVDEFDVSTLFNMSDDLSSIASPAYSGRVHLYSAIQAGLERLGYVNPLTPVNISSYYPLQMMVVPEATLRHAFILKDGVSSQFMPYFLEKLIENHDDWVHIFTAIQGVKSLINELDVYVARYFSTDEYRLLDVADKETVLLGYLHLRGGERWHDVSATLPQDLARKHLSRLLHLHFSESVISEICEYYFVHSMRSDSIMVGFFLGEYTREEVEDVNGETFLHDISVIDFPDAALVTELITQGFQVNAANDRGMTPLMYACYESASHSVAALLLHHAEINVQDHAGLTALHYACIANDPVIVHMLLEGGAYADVFDRRGNSPLHYACQYGNETIVLLLLKQNLLLLDMLSHQGLSPLSHAIQGDCYNIVKILLDHEASTEYLQKPHVFLLLNMLARHDYPEITVPLLRRFLVQYLELIKTKLKTVRRVDAEAVGVELARINADWNSRKYLRTIKSHSVQRLLNLLDGVDHADKDPGRIKLEKSEWETSLFSSKRLRLFVDTYQTLEDMGMVKGDDTLASVSLRP